LAEAARRPRRKADRQRDVHAGRRPGADLLAEVLAAL